MALHLRGRQCCASRAERSIGSLAAGLVAGLMAVLAPPPADAASFGHSVDALFATAVKGGPGYVIGVVEHGELVFARGYGFADVARRRPLTPDTPMNLASLSKQFTAAAIALEIKRGRLALDDRLVDRWPELPQYMRVLTVGHLVYMTSGLPEYYRLPPTGRGWGPEDGFTVEDALTAVRAAGALDFEPGSRWAYSNTNYQMLAELVARLNGLPFPQHMQTAVFAPLGMRDTWVDAPPMPQRDDRSLAYVRAGRGWTIAHRGSRHYGGGGMFASLRDLARWDAALYRDRTFGAEFTTLMLSTRRYGHDKTNDAFGLVHGTFEGRATLWYEGGDHGVSTYMMRLTDSGQTIICLSNIGGGDCASKARAVARLLIAAGDLRQPLR